MERSLYFGKPSNWTKLQAPAKLEEAKAINSQAQFHNKALNRVKESLGKSCTFLTHYTGLEKSGFKAILIISGKPQVLLIVDDVPPFGMLKATDYKNLNDTLKSYVRGKKNIRES